MSFSLAICNVTLKAKQRKLQATISSITQQSKHASKQGNGKLQAISYQQHYCSKTMQAAHGNCQPVCTTAKYIYWQREYLCYSRQHDHVAALRPYTIKAWVSCLWRTHYAKTACKQPSKRNAWREPPFTREKPVTHLFEVEFQLRQVMMHMQRILSRLTITAHTLHGAFPALIKLYE